MAFAKALSLYSEIEQISWCNLQNFTEFKNYVKRNTYIPQFDRTNVTSVDIYKFRQLKLCHFFPFSIIHNVQAEFFIQFLIFSFHAYHPVLILRVLEQ